MRQTSFCDILSLDQLACGDAESWNELWESPLAKKLYRDYQKYGYDGEDLFQDVMMEFFHAVGRYVEKGITELPVYGILQTIALRAEADFVKKKKRRNSIATLISWQFTDDDGNKLDVELLYVKNNGFEVNWEEELLEQDEVRKMLLSVYEKLDNGVITAEQYKLLKMSYVENKSDRVIAEELGENINTIKSRRQRAQKKLRKSFQTQVS